MDDTSMVRLISSGVLTLFPPLQKINWIAFARVYRFSQMRNEDLPAVLELEKSVYPEPWPLHVFLFELNSNASAHAYIIRHRLTKTIHGYIMFRKQNQMVHLTNLVVAPAVQGRGLGTALLGFCCIKSVRMGARWVQLEVRVSNEQAIRLYTKFGFQVLYTMPSYYKNGEDAYLMILPLPSISGHDLPHYRNTNES